MPSDNSFRIETYSRVKHDFKRLDKTLQTQILQEHYPHIALDPYQADPLSYNFKGLWSYHINYQGRAYRIVYEIYPEQAVVLVIMIGSREGFYEALRRRIQG